MADHCYIFCVFFSSIFNILCLNFGIPTRCVAPGDVETRLLHLLVALALGQGSRPPAIRLAFGPFGRTLVTLDKSGPALDAQVIAGIVIKLERSYQAVGRIARIGALWFAWASERGGCHGGHVMHFFLCKSDDSWAVSYIGIGIQVFG